MVPLYWSWPTSEEAVQYIVCKCIHCGVVIVLESVFPPGRLSVSRKAASTMPFLGMFHREKAYIYIWLFFSWGQHKKLVASPMKMVIRYIPWVYPCVAHKLLIQGGGLHSNAWGAHNHISQCLHVVVYMYIQL